MKANDLSRRSLLIAGTVAMAAGETGAARPKTRPRDGSGAAMPTTPWKVAFEEHYLTPDFNPIPPSMTAALAGRSAAAMQPMIAKLLEVGDHRIALMDEAKIQYSILSLNTPGVQGETDRARSIDRAKRANDELKRLTDRYPKRLGGFAALPTLDARASADELERCVRDLGFHGALINSFATLPGDRALYLDDPRYDVLWERACALRQPIYLHPRNMVPGQCLLFDERPELLAATWGYLVECSTHALRMIVGGVFDRFPQLKICLGHLGEALPAAQWRIAETYRLKFGAGKLKLGLGEYIKNNFVYGTGGFFDTIAMQNVINTVGAERVCFSTDYPWMEMSKAHAWFDNAEIDRATKLKIGRGNAVDLFGLKL